MATRTPLVLGEFYHIYNRGTEKRTIFEDARDWERMTTLLYTANAAQPIHLSNRQGSTLPRILAIQRGEVLVDMVAYCLMPNHFHFLLREKAEGGISAFMQKLSTAYTMYFNTRYERTGSLFQGRFKSSHADNDRYLQYLIAYIHLNPIQRIEPQWKDVGIQNKKAARAYLEEYPYSSYSEYSNRPRQAKVILNNAVLPGYLNELRIFNKFITDWLAYRDA